MKDFHDELMDRFIEMKNDMRKMGYVWRKITLIETVAEYCVEIEWITIEQRIIEDMKPKSPCD